MKKLKYLIALFILINANNVFASQGNIQTINLENYQNSDVVSSADFESTLLQAMMSLGDNNYIKVKKVNEGYIIKVIAGANPSAIELKCCGTGVSFANCVKGLLEEHPEITVTKCKKSCGTYCAYIP